MSKYRRGGLGRGLGALIPTAAPDEPDETDEAQAQQRAVDASTESAGKPAERAAPQSPSEPATEPAAEPLADTDLAAVPGAAFAELPISEIRPNPRQPRQVFDDDALAELTHSIREFGVLQPVVVRTPTGEHGTGWELVMGERRLRAAAAAGLETIPAIVRSTADDAMLRDALLENVHRAQLNPLEEAAAYQQLLAEFGATHDDLAQRLGRSRPQVTNTIRLLNLSLPVQRRVAAGVISAGHARALLSLEDANHQDELAARIVAEGLSVRATEELVALVRSGKQETAPKRRARAPRISAPALGELADRLSDVLDTRVRVDIGRRKGKITVEFASIDDLERIVGVMAPSIATTPSGGAGQPVASRVAEPESASAEAVPDAPRAPNDP